MDRRRYFLQARFLRRPLHPFLAHIAFAAPLAVVALDAVSYFGEPSAVLTLTAYWVLIVGAAFAVLTALTGAADVAYETSADIFPRARRAARVHALGMTAFIVLIIASIGVRYVGQEAAGVPVSAILLSLAGTLVMIYMSYVGGKLVFVHGIRVEGGDGVQVQRSEEPEGPLPPNVHRFPQPRLHLRRKHKEGEE